MWVFKKLGIIQKHRITNLNLKTMEEKSIALLNKLVEINNDRLLGYETAFNDTEDTDLKKLFADFSVTSKDLKKELQSEITKLGGKPSEDSHVTGTLHRVWMDLKSAISGKSRATILSSCEFGDNTAIEAYDKALVDSTYNLTSVQKTMIMNQQMRIQSDLNKVKILQSVLA